MTVLIGFFLKYLLAPLSAVVGIIVINVIGKANKAMKMKKLIIFILLLSLILVIPSLFGLLKYEFIWAGLILTILTYLILGLVFNWFMTFKTFKSIGIHEKTGLVIFSIIISMMLGIWLYYHAFSFLNRLNYAEWSMTSVLWFLVPILSRFTRLAFLEVPSPVYKDFFLSNQKIDEEYWNNIDTFRAMQVNVRIKRRETSRSDAAFSVRLPDDISIGGWFKRFIEDQNIRFPEHQIEIADTSSNEYSWACYTTRWFSVPMFVRIIDFEENVRSGKIRKKGYIYLRRVRTNA
ncbi:MAG: TssN family type VI secretion system protein [Bacteroidota bacterium]